MMKDLRALDSYLRWQLRLHALTQTQRALAEILCDLTFARGIETVRLLRQEDLGKFLRIGRNKVSPRIRELAGMAIVKVEGKDYSILPRSSVHEWKVALIQDETQVRAWMDEIATLNGAQEEWWRPETTLLQMVAKAEAEARPPAVPERGTRLFPKGEQSRPITGDGDLHEISNLHLLSSMGVGEESQLKGKARALAEQAHTDAAQAVTVDYRSDGYLMDKLTNRPGLQRELMDGRTPTARRFAVLYRTKPDRARELLGTAITRQGNPAAWLNVTLKNEGERY